MISLLSLPYCPYNLFIHLSLHSSNRIVRHDMLCCVARMALTYDIRLRHLDDSTSIELSSLLLLLLLLLSKKRNSDLSTSESEDCFKYRRRQVGFVIAGDCVDLLQ